MKLIVFDLDGTLAESKQPLAGNMAALVAKLLDIVPVAVISGAALPQFVTQVVDQLPDSANLTNLYLSPTSGAALYEYRAGEWNKIYEERISEKEAHGIEDAIRMAAAKTGLVDFSTSAWGKRIEHRGGQVTLSALGQQAPLALKKEWDPDRKKRFALRELLITLLPNFTVGIGGVTSIDVTKRGIDKAYGIRKLCERLGIDESETLYVGDELESGGNDEAVFKTNAQTRAVASPEDTEQVILSLLPKLILYSPYESSHAS